VNLKKGPSVSENGLLGPDSLTTVL